MPVLLFLIDTSASMNQRAHLGTTYLDIAKGAVETFMKLRSRDPASRGDRYMLVTFEEFPSGIKAGWKENHATFMHELKNLQAVGLTTVGQSLRTAFDLLNLNRLVSGIDNYGQGRNPFFLEPSIIVTITDGSKLTSNSGVQDELHLPLSTPLPGSELTKEPFRWDQRLFALVLRIPGNMAVEPEQMIGVPQDDSAITPMCEVTGDGPPDTSKLGPQVWHSCHKLIYVRPNPKTGVPIGHWPIPEAFWPDQNSPTLVGVYPSRTAHPQVRFSCIDSEPMVIDKLPFDKYELEPSPLTQYILERKSPHTCWQPLKKALRMMGAPNLIAENMEYGLSYSVVSYLKKLSQQAKAESDRVIALVGKKPVQENGVQVKNKASTLSLAHCKDFKQLLKGITGEAPHVLQELNMKEFTGFQIGILNKDLKPQSFRNAYDIPRRSLLDHLSRMRSNLLKAAQGLLKGQDEDQLHSIPIAQMGNYQEFLKLSPSPLREVDPDQPKRLHTFGNPFKLDKKAMGTDFNVLFSDQLHSIPIAQMGNYQEFLKLSPSPLREVDPDQPKRLHTFGNPFKLDKKGMMIDEADEFVSGPQNKSKRPGDPSMQGVPKRRRCMSPLLRGGRPLTPPAVNNHIGGKGPPSIPVTMAHPNLVKPIPVCKDGVVENHIGSQHSLETLPDPVPDLNSDTDPFNMKQLPAGVENHIGELRNNRSGVDDLYTVSPTGTHEDSEEGEACLVEGLHQSHKMKKLNNSKSEENNAELKVLITREIRKPGRRYERIFYFLEQVQGSLHTRLLFLQNVIKEAARFKKRVLIEQLEGFLEEIHCRYNQMNHVDSI
ncbi:UNVERIFIED_CONTAM: hypothetical protein FKN15_035128 [Acipenser sinensis]